MSYLNRLLRKVVAPLGGNRISQKILRKIVMESQYQMGIGAGGDVAASGERSIFSLIRKRLDPPYCIFDVGANRGQFLGMVLEELGEEELAVHSFEPGEKTFGMLKGNCGDDGRVTLNNTGLGKAAGEHVLYYDTPGSGLASLTKRNLDHIKRDFNLSETVMIDTVDNYCSEHPVDRIHLLKMDVEGHELDVLEGAEGMFNRGAIDMVSFEFGGCNIDTRTFFRDHYYYLSGAGFDIFRITPSGYFYRLDDFNEADEQYRTTNFLAVSNRN